MDEPDESDPGLAGLSPEFQAMIGGMQGHAASFQKLLERRSAQLSKSGGKKKDDEVYLESYAELDIHEDMLKDGPRVKSYQEAIEFYGPRWKDQNISVVDVGAGTGLLSIFCAKAGASKVHAVEASRLAYFTRQIAEANTAPGTVEVHEVRAEDLDLGQDVKVDVVVSEWMGYFLFFENMLPSVLSVRDRYLKPDGLMLPSSCRLYLAPLEDSAWRSSKLGFWKNVSGIDMSALVPLAEATACEKPLHRQVPADGLLSTPIEIGQWDLKTVKESALKKFEAPLSFKIEGGRRLDGFASWFDCTFGEAPRLLSTAPTEELTHWRQTAFYFRTPLEGGGGVDVTGTVTVEQHEDFSRGYRVTFDLQAPGRKSRLETFELR